MRSPGGLDSDFVNSGQWNDRAVNGERYSSLEFEMVDGVRKPKVNSISGNERNKLFLNVNGNNFDDVSLISGTDSIADGRCFTIWDFDHDGWQDIALLNMNTPHLQILRNNRLAAETDKNGFVAVRLVGGNDSATPDSGWSNRTGVGAVVKLLAGNKTILREQRCGEGFSSQNSATMIIGFGDGKSADRISVQWPSGRTGEVSAVPSGSLVTFYENPDLADDGQPVKISEYQKAGLPNAAAVDSKSGPFDFPETKMSADGAQLRVLITMAPWCESCKRHLPKIAELKQSVAETDVAFYGVPVDAQDSTAKLDEYVKQFDPPYQLLTTLDNGSRERTTNFIEIQLGSRALPCTIISNASGEPLAVQFGIPSISAIRKILDEIKNQGKH